MQYQEEEDTRVFPALHGRPTEKAPEKEKEPERAAGPEAAETVREPEQISGSAGTGRSRKREQVRENETWFRTSDACITAFLLPMLILLIIFFQRGIYPFGSNCFLRTDMYHQYAPFFSEFRNKLRSGGSLLYSWDVGLGVNFSAIYAYYLASPFNWLIALVPKKFIIEFMTGLIVLKTGLSGLSFTWYLDRSGSRPHFYACFFGIFYALSGYMAAYSWNLMWLDCIAVFPILIYGLERLVREKKSLLYAVCLAFAISSNYYISIMICMFLVICFFMLIALERRMNFRRFLEVGVRFAAASLLAGGIAAAILIPEIYALQATASADISFPKTFSSYFSILAMLARHMPDVTTETGLDHWPNIYCGVMVYVLMVTYILNPKIRVREKAVYATVVVFLFASFSINVLNYIWHGLHYPNSLPARQSFIYIFLVLFMCYRSLDRSDGITMKTLGIAFLSSAAFILIAQEFADQKHLSFDDFYFSLVLIAIYCLFLYIYFDGRLNFNILMFVILGLTAVEASVNMSVTSVPTTNRDNYIADNADVIRLVRSVPDDPFVRFEKVTRKSKDDGAWMNFHSVSLFSSVADANLTRFFRELGCESSTNAYSITGSTPLVDALLDVRYGLYSDEQDNPYIKKVAQSGETFLYENPSVFPLAFLTDANLEENWVRTGPNPADVQNDLCNVMQTDPVLVEVVNSTDGSTYLFDVPEDGVYYGFAQNASVKKITAKLPDRNRTFDNLDRRFFLELGMLREGDQVTFSAADEDDRPDLAIYRFDFDALAALNEKLMIRPLNISIMSDTEIEGTLRADNDCILMTSIPYDKGWKVTIDGKETDTLHYFEALLAVRVSPGEHVVRMVYRPQGRTLGILITILSILLLAAGTLFERRVLLRSEARERHFARRYDADGTLFAEKDDDDDSPGTGASSGKISGAEAGPAAVKAAGAEGKAGPADRNGGSLQGTRRFDPVGETKVFSDNEMKRLVVTDESLSDTRVFSEAYVREIIDSADRGTRVFTEREQSLIRRGERPDEGNASGAGGNADAAEETAAGETTAGETAAGEDAAGMNAAEMNAAEDNAASDKK